MGLFSFCSPSSRRRALAASINRFVDKNGRILSFNSQQGSQPVHYLRALLLGEQSGIVPVQVRFPSLGVPGESHSTMG